ncbi:MAG: hypothetical protein AUJ51_08570 [Elusimicrobia bacterium CG1_02_56_21]|nr:MAG: hypothetical protein AUJ51_08570 [Elusimicrobia bacterium CG1_02_56_21]
MLFLAHRDQILDQSLATLRNVLKEPDFGVRMGGPHGTPTTKDHLFCTIQTANSQELWKELGAGFYDYIVVDEAHHAPAGSYKGIFEGFSPGILLGLTATPERMDGESSSDPVSVEDDRFWQAGKYSTSALEQAYVDDAGQAGTRVSGNVEYFTG